MKTFFQSVLLVTTASLSACSVDIVQSPEEKNRPSQVGCVHTAPDIPCDSCMKKNRLLCNRYFKAKYDAAMRITSSQTRDAALSDIAVNASSWLNVEYTRKAIISMTSSLNMDQAVKFATDQFIEQYQLEQAREIAMLARSSQTRDAILKKIATTPSPVNKENHI